MSWLKKLVSKHSLYNFVLQVAIYVILCYIISVLNVYLLLCRQAHTFVLICMYQHVYVDLSVYIYAYRCICTCV